VLIGMASDSHDNLNTIRRAVDAFRERGVARLIHAGDFVAPFAARAFLKLDVPITAVFGNCDGEHQVIAELLPDIVTGARRETLGGRTFVVVHSQDWLAPGEADGADVLVCGHTHLAKVANQEGLLVVNPGEVGGWVTGRASAAVLDTESLDVDVFDLN
jgi:uncharacterized protein